MSSNRTQITETFDPPIYLTPVKASVAEGDDATPKWKCIQVHEGMLHITMEDGRKVVLPQTPQDTIPKEGGVVTVSQPYERRVKAHIDGGGAWVEVLLHEGGVTRRLLIMNGILVIQ